MAVAAGSSGSRRLAALAGAASLAYVVWVIVDLVVLSTSGVAYTQMHQSLGSLGFRLVLCAAWLALLYHGLDGVRVALLDTVPRLAARERVARGMVSFVLLAIWIPTALVIVWPAVRRWFAA